jgi:hypothetical protein
LRGLTKRLFGRIDPAEPLQYLAEIGMRLDAAWVENRCAFTARDRFGEMPLIAQREPKIAVSGGEIGPQGDGAAIAGAGLGEPARRSQDVAEIGMALREIGRNGERFADQQDSLIVVAASCGEDAEQMQSVRIAGRLLQKLSVKRLRAIESSGPMMVEGGGEVGDRHRLAPPIGAVTAARHVASIPPPAHTYVLYVSLDSISCKRLECSLV